MRHTCGCILALALVAACLSHGAEEMRPWRDRKGASVEAAFVREENGVVTLRRADGVTVQARLDALSDEDNAYVREITYVPQEIVSIFKTQQDRLGPRLVEVGTSPSATSRDRVRLRTLDEQAGQKAESRPDTEWHIESVNVVGNLIRPARDDQTAAELRTEGRFVFLMYRVKNESLGPIDVPSPMLRDQKGRRFSQVESRVAHLYIPEGASLAGMEALQPGFSRMHVAFYEIPEDATPTTVEVFPATIRAGMLRLILQGNNEVCGKQIALSLPGDLPDRAVAAETPSAATPGASGERVAIFMRCSRLGQSGEASTYWVFDRNRKRAFTYGIELRLMGKEPRPIRIKAFFVGAGADNRDMVVDLKEADMVLDPGKFGRTTLQSDEIPERPYYTADGTLVSGARLKGVIIQAWAGSELAASWASLNQWNRFAEAPDVLAAMGDLRQGR